MDPTKRSARGDEHFEAMNVRLRAYSTVRAVRGLRERAKLLRPEPPAPPPG
ncbi:hypothetical protein ACIPJK_18415 [Streptomyces roseus]|uniref:hypothetical protein n=1 Tax=Streptomyces roseus TaxID=66430 RepID=UPI0037FD45C8